MAKIQNTTSNADMDVEQLKLIHCWGATRKVQPTLEDSLAVSYKTKYTIQSSNHTFWYIKS